MYKLTVTHDDRAIRAVNLKKIKAGQSLLEVCLEHDIDIAHDCGGVCYCTTCRVTVEKGGEHLEEMERREQDFLSKLPSPKAGLRLACQAVLKDGKGEVAIRLPKAT